MSTRRPPRSDSGFLERLGLHRPELRAWAMYDWANSAMVTTVVAAVFPAFFSAVVAVGLTPEQALVRYANTTTIALAILAFISPVVGAIADVSPAKKRLLGAFMAVGVLGVIGMFFIRHGEIRFASMLFIVANVGAGASFVVYDSLLPHVARQDEIDRVSTSGYALGYFGGGILLALNLAWIMAPGAFGLPSGPDLTPEQSTLPTRLALLSVAVWWVLFSIPFFRGVPEPPRALEPDESPYQNRVTIAYTRLYETFRELRGYKQAFLLLLAFLVYNDGIGTIIRMATIYGEQIGIGRETMILAILITQFVGVPFSFAFGTFAGWIGPKAAIFVGLLIYMGITVLGYFMTSGTHFLLLAILVGMVQGGTQALSRSLFASMIPKHKAGEFFGFFAVFEKFAGIFGPWIMSMMIVLSGSTRFGILSLILFFVVGGILLALVDVNEGRVAARAAEEHVRVLAETEPVV